MDPVRPRQPSNQAAAVDEEVSGDEAIIQSVAPTSEGSHRREHSRFAVDLEVSVGSEHNFYAGFAENLSAGGVFVATHKLKPVRSLIELTINLPDGVSVRATGEVRWIRVFNEHSDSPPGMGVKFDALDDVSVAAIESFLARRDPLFFEED
ncbi:MAG TPA: TIGR02266 family protein [Polyangiaceae bacterium]